MAATPLPLLAPVTALLTLGELAVGTQAVAWAIDLRRRVGRGYRGTTALIAAVLAALAVGVAATLPDPRTIVATGDPALFAAAVHWLVATLALLVVDALFAVVGTDPAHRVTGALGVLSGVVAVSCAALAFAPPDGERVAIEVATVAATLLMGAAMAGMLLGHWYLIAPDLTFAPLRLAVHTVFLALVVQAAVIAVALIRAPAPLRHDVTAGTYAVPLWLLVIGAGVVFTAAVNGLTWYFTRIRANQPATAMLYVLIISVLMGTVPASLVLLRTGVPL